MAQDQTRQRDQERKQDQIADQTRTRSRDQEHLRSGEQLNHGQAVSETARNTESGKGKGQIVSARARTMGESHQARNMHMNSARNRSGFSGMGAKGNGMHANAMKMYGGLGKGRR